MIQLLLDPPDNTEQRFLDTLKVHLDGLRAKVKRDFCEKGFGDELAKLEGDELYLQFGLATPEYALVRLVGRISISIGRRLGELYDKIPRLLAAARFGLDKDDVSPRLDGLELDVCLKYALLSNIDQNRVRTVARGYLTAERKVGGLGIEVRYNFNPNDSARLRKDVQMAGLLAQQDLLPIYLVFSSISPREEAIARLARAGWQFLIGEEATRFMNELIGLDIGGILLKPSVRHEISRIVEGIMDEMVRSYAFSAVVSRHKDG